MIVLSGAELVLPDRILSPGTLVIDGGRIADIRSGVAAARNAGGYAASLFAFHGHYIVPGFIDVHVHGVDGIDSLDAADAVRSIAARMPRYGVTAFCPTTVACAPGPLRGVLDQVRRARETPEPRSARVLPAHLESNFINPDMRGAQPLACLRSPRAALADGSGGERLPPASSAPVAASLRPRPNAPDAPASGQKSRGWGPSAREKGRAGAEGAAGAAEDFDAADIIVEIERAAPDVGIVTIASELEGGLDLVRWLSTRGHRVSLGHSNATYDEALAAIAAGARHATHLFNRMPPLAHRAPGLAGAILQTDEIAAELICDCSHVHPALVRTAIAAKRPSRIMAITDATAAAGLPVGRRARLGGHSITAGESAAYLDDGTIAGSVLTMDRALQLLVGRIGLSPVDAVTLCSTTPARELGLVGHGILAPEAVADLVVLDAQFSVVQTYIGGQLAYSRSEAS
jgi:N-acetylglucosamine-6-phosphate deacetylase